MAEGYLTDDEELEQVKRAVAENWLWVVGGIVIGGALIVGYRYYQTHRNEQALRAAGQFETMTSALERNDAAASRQIAHQLIDGYPSSPYADQAQLAMAKLDVDGGKLADAIAPLSQVMNGSKDGELRHVARLRLARVLIAEGKPDDAIKTLADDNSEAFAADAHEVRGDAFYAKQDLKGARLEYQAALDSGNAGADAALLQLKIADLGASSTAATASTDSASSNKVKP